MLSGIFPVIPTCFTESDGIDFESQRSVIRFALDAGAHGVVFPGVASEYNYLTPDERGTLISFVAEEVGGQVPIVGGASAPTPDEAIVAGKQALENGVTHLMLMAPKGLGDNIQAHSEFFSKVSTALPGAEFILQNAPSPVGAGLDAKAVLAIASENVAVTYAKEETLPSGPTITALQAANVPHLKGIFGGGGARYIINELDRGAIGAIPAVELTDVHVALFEAHSSGDHQRARELYRNSLPLLACQAIYRMRLTKYVLAKRRVADAQGVRAPLPPLDESAQRDVDQMLLDLELTT